MRKFYFPLPLTLFFIACISICSTARADPIYHLYGITPLNVLVEIDPEDPLFEQRSVGTFSPSSVIGIEYDSVRDRILALDTTGITYTVDQNSAATSPLTDFSSFGQPQFSALAFDASASPSDLYVSQNETENNQIIRAFDMGGFYEVAIQFPYDALISIRGISIAPSDSALFALRRDILNGLDILSQVEKIQGTLVQNFTITGASNVSGIAFHPVSGLLYGTTDDGTLVQIDRSTGAATVLKTYTSNQTVAVGDLAFIPVTPTPTATATATATPTSTPTPTATICPTLSAECGCNSKPIDLDKGSTVCGPADTLTKKTVPEAPEIQSQGNTVTLILQDFSAVSDGKGIDILTAGVSLEREDDDTLEARRKASIRYDVNLKNTSSRTRDAINKQSRRNQVSFRKLPPGNYSALYRVTIIRNKKEIGTSRYSPRTKFKVRQSRK